MLSKLLPNQVAAYWDSIKHGVEQSCPADVVLTPTGLNSYLIALMSGNLQAWLLTEPTPEKVNYFGNLITKIQTDEITGVKTLLLVSLYLYESAPVELWQDAYAKLELYGKANDCKKIVAYTTNPAILQRGNQFGFNTEWMVLAKEI